MRQREHQVRVRYRQHLGQSTLQPGIFGPCAALRAAPVSAGMVLPVAVTAGMHRSELTARAVALVYNCWSWYVRAANPQARREALTSRPLLLAAVGRATHSGGRTELHLTPMHAEVGLIKTMIANVQQAIAYVKRSAEQLPKIDRWHILLGYICERITHQSILPSPPPALAGGG